MLEVFEFHLFCLCAVCSDVVSGLLVKKFKFLSRKNYSYVRVLTLGCGFWNNAKFILCILIPGVSLFFGVNNFLVAEFHVFPTIVEHC